ncbi:hypothetical protein BDZ97DRAFT_1911792 [Flammula alnicola]|nr:hypothetical protein BDZ97DRAFT_1911792 [Flammula alnicola]
MSKSTKKSGHAEPSDATVIKEDSVDEIAIEKARSRKKKTRASTATQIVDEAPLPLEELPKKSKKRKHGTDDLVNQVERCPTSQIDDAQEEPAKKKKKHKNRTEFADPKEDETLNNQCRKALEYVFTQMNRPSKWKFNKARQNWLIRNIWTPEAISDTYFPLVLKYLTTVQGGSREKLKESCQTHLNVQVPTDTTEPAPVVPSEVPKSILKVTSPIKPTPGPLIQPSPVAGPLVTADSSTPIPTASSVTTTALADIRRTRAQRLLRALSSSTTPASAET